MWGPGGAGWGGDCNNGHYSEQRQDTAACHHTSPTRGHRGGGGAVGANKFTRLVSLSLLFMLS